MQFDSLAAALEMAGHGGYVWTVYGITFVAVTWLLLGPLLRSRRIQKAQLALLRGELARQRRAQETADAANKGEVGASSS